MGDHEAVDFIVVAEIDLDGLAFHRARLGKGADHEGHIGLGIEEIQHLIAVGLGQFEFVRARAVDLFGALQAQLVALTFVVEQFVFEIVLGGLFGLFLRLLGRFGSAGEGVEHPGRRAVVSLDVLHVLELGRHFLQVGPHGDHFGGKGHAHVDRITGKAHRVEVFPVLLSADRLEVVVDDLVDIGRLLGKGGSLKGNGQYGQQKRESFHGP